jgi:hypothetical protein
MQGTCNYLKSILHVNKGQIAALTLAVTQKEVVRYFKNKSSIIAENILCLFIMLLHGTFQTPKSAIHDLFHH